jgi:hypothetical protein
MKKNQQLNSYADNPLSLSLQALPRTRTRWEIGAGAAWLTVLLVIAGHSFLAKPRSHSTYLTFVNAARHWSAGQDIYSQVDAKGYFDDFRYSPTVAAFLVPFSLLPDPLGSFCWRLLNLALMCGAFWWWLRCTLPQPLSRAHLGLMFLFLLPLSVGNVFIAQSNPLVLGLLLGALAAVRQQRWNLASVGLALACLFKVYPIAIGLLLVALYPRRLGVRLVLALAIGLALPFLWQNSDYVSRQYGIWWSYLTSEDRQNLPAATTYRDLRLLWRVWLVPLAPSVYLAVQLVTAAGSALVCLAGRFLGWSQRRLLTLLLGLGCCWMTAFGVATESATYMLVAPSAAWAVLEAWTERRTLVLRLLFLGSYGLLLAAQIANWFPGSSHFHALGIQPLATLILFLGLLAAEVKRPWDHGSGDRSAGLVAPGQAA